MVYCPKTIFQSKGNLAFSLCQMITSLFFFFFSESVKLLICLSWYSVGTVQFCICLLADNAVKFSSCWLVNCYIRPLKYLLDVHIKFNVVLLRYGKRHYYHFTLWMVARKGCSKGKHSHTKWQYIHQQGWTSVVVTITILLAWWKG